MMWIKRKGIECMDFAGSLTTGTSLGLLAIFVVAVLLGVWIGKRYRKGRGNGPKRR